MCVRDMKLCIRDFFMKKFKGLIFAIILKLKMCSTSICCGMYLHYDWKDRKFFSFKMFLLSKMIEKRNSYQRLFFSVCKYCWNNKNVLKCKKEKKTQRRDVYNLVLLVIRTYGKCAFDLFTFIRYTRNMSSSISCVSCDWSVK